MADDYNMVATLKVMPETIDIDLESLKAAITKVVPENMELYKIDEEPIAFGLVALMPMVLMSDKQGGNIDPLQEAFQAVEGVGEVDVTDVRRLFG